MNGEPIKNFAKLATTKNREIALRIMESGLNAINTKKVVSSFVSLSGDILSIKNKTFDLSKWNSIKIVGFGKSSCEAALALEDILGSRIKEGAVIGLSKEGCKYIETYKGTHPRPSLENLEAGERIKEIITGSDSKDLIIVIASGGGSALLCSDKGECESGIKLYDSFLKSGKTINEMNTVRKHLSTLKGGGLAKMAYPATVVGLIFSDVPGDNFADVASGPTYKDETTIDDAKKIIDENNLGEFNLIETPKESKYFDNVYNFVLVSNKIAVEAMALTVHELGFEPNIISTDLYDEVDKVLDKLFGAKKGGSVVLAAGEPSVIVPDKSGKGGRNLHMALKAIERGLIDGSSVFIPFASDGMDNSDASGAIVDKKTEEKINKLGIDVKDSLERFDSYPVFEKSGDMIITGPTGANVSDLMILLNGK